jgi:dihydrofolate reductase
MTGTTTPKTVFYTATTLDGFIADPSDSLDWLFVQDIDENGPMNYNSFIAGVGALVMGARPTSGSAGGSTRAGRSGATRCRPP